MLRSSALTWSYLHCLTKRRFDALMEAFGNLDEPVKLINEDFLKALGCKRDSIIPTLNRLESFDIDAYEKALTKLDLSFISIDDVNYPKRLKEIPDPPIFLYYRGDLSILDHPCVALVGTREMTPYGQRVVEHLVPPIVRAGCITVSGLARGVDTIVAEETLACGGPARPGHPGGRHAAILGNGLATIFPAQNAKLARKIVDNGGLILSEFPIDMQGDTYTFPARNRIIAALSLGTVVCEAPEKSGALITADLALEYGRDVFVVPGSVFDPNFAGCHRFLSRGQAKLVTSAEDILKEIGVITKCMDVPVQQYEAQSDIEKTLLNILTAMPQAVDDLATKASLPSSEMSSALTMLELAGAAKKIDNGWIRA